MKHKETEAIHRGEGADPSAAPLTTPIYETSTFLFESTAELESFQAGTSTKYLYSRYGNPTVRAVEQKIAALEGADAAMLLSSGMAAVSTALFGLLKAGDELVCSAAIYGGTLQVIRGYLEKFGVHARFAPIEEFQTPTRLISEKTRLVWFESPINPTLRCIDIAGVAAACKARGVTSAIDNTFASPLNQSPLTLGIDLIMHSATKYINGHSDVTAGALVGSTAMIKSLQPARKLIGGMIDPAAAFAVGRGIKTIGVRIARHNQNAMAVAQYLETHPKVSAVFYPGLASHPDHAVAKKQMTGGFGGMVTFEAKDGFAGASRFFDRMQVFKRAASLGGVDSLASLPVLTSQWGFSDAQLKDAGVTRGMVRLSVGIEHIDDLIADLQQALNG
ncbi:MAG: aminotransferase class I/II-fold pyridoxal phosphate-dependent enzyme [Acidobacteria bacterium]|nr:MAG: aminotransferase class I/II-fold pyridoxal phosphate-dependent enzyme [Acidobacteriota bacterium]